MAITSNDFFADRYEQVPANVMIQQTPHSQAHPQVPTSEMGAFASKRPRLAVNPELTRPLRIETHDMDPKKVND